MTAWLSNILLWVSLTKIILGTFSDRQGESEACRDYGPDLVWQKAPTPQNYYFLEKIIPQTKSILTVDLHRLERLRIGLEKPGQDRGFEVFPLVHCVAYNETYKTRFYEKVGDRQYRQRELSRDLMKKLDRDRRKSRPIRFTSQVFFSIFSL